MARPKILNTFLEKWLEQNYPDMDNDVLAAQLTIMVNKENAKEASQLTLSLNDVCGKDKVKVLARIDLLNQNVNLNVASIASIAHRMGLKKSKAKIYSIRSNAVRRADFSKYRGKAVKVDSVKMFLDSIPSSVKDIYIILESEKKMHSFSVILSRWNKVHGRDRGMFLFASYDYRNCIVNIKAKTV